MEFLIISDTKLKVSISRNECLKYGIDTSEADFSTNEIRLVIREILDLAEERCGFKVGREKILVQLYPIPEGNCELFVTKLVGLSARERGIVRDSDELTTYQSKRGVYRFSDVQTLKSAVLAIYRDSVDCDLYLSDAGDYYISIAESFTDGISEFEVLIEFGERLGELPIFVIAEYGTLISRGDGLKSALALPDESSSF